MTQAIVVFLLFCAAFAAQGGAAYQLNPPAADGTYAFAFNTADQITRREESEVKNAGTENEVLVVKGEYSYVVDGKQFTVYYIADENGYRTLEESPFAPPVHHFPPPVPYVPAPPVHHLPPPPVQQPPYRPLTYFPPRLLGSAIGGGL